MFYLFAISGIVPFPVTNVEEFGIKNWPIRTFEASFFDWTYDDKETCFLLEGAVTVNPDGGESLKFGAGDLLVFPVGIIVFLLISLYFNSRKLPVLTPVSMTIFSA